MNKYAWLLVAAATLAFACGGGGGVKAASPACPPPTPAVAGSQFPDAVKAEAWLAAAGVPYFPRPELISPTFPEGCGWHAVYATEKPEVILEVYSFGDVFLAEDFITNRNADYSVMDIAQEYAIVNNGNLVLVARYNETGDDGGKMDRMNVFATTFVAGK